MRCKVKIKDSEIVIGRENARDLISSQKDGYYALSIKKWDRTIEQNNTMWMWIDILKDHHGYSKQEMYDALIDAYSWPYTYRNLKGKPEQKMVTSSMMSIDEMSEFMDRILQHAAEENVKLPMPEYDG